jgi:hypothetical protein
MAQSVALGVPRFLDVSIVEERPIGDVADLLEKYQLFSRLFNRAAQQPHPQGQGQGGAMMAAERQ